MKPKNKVRKSGYYWVKRPIDINKVIAQHFSGSGTFYLCGRSNPYFASQFKYISTRPLKPGKK